MKKYLFKLKYLIFLLVFIYTFHWVAINLFLTSVDGEKIPITVVESQEIRNLIKDKTGLDIKTIKISESNRLFGMMIGIPTKPQLILSRNLYDTFNSGEIEYVVLHEAGHYILQHGLMEFLIGLFLQILGIWLIMKVEKIPAFAGMTENRVGLTNAKNEKNFIIPLIPAIFLGLFFGILMIQLGKIHEIKADEFTVKKMTDPTGMISATNKFRSFYGPKYSENNNKLIQFLFYRGNPYDNRILIAEKEIKERKITQ